MKRKPLNLNADGIYKSSDFYRRFSNTFARDLKDHRYSSEFSLNENKRYKDDIN